MKNNLDTFLAGASALAVCALLASGCQSNQTACCNVRPTPTPAAAPATPATPAAAAPAGKAALKFVTADSEETAGEDGKGANAVDGDPNTFWHTQWQDANPPCPHEIIVELTPAATIKGFTYLPRQDGGDHGNIKGYEFYTSNDGQDFGQPVAKGEFADGQDLKTVTFSAPQTCRFIKLKALSEINGEAWTSAAEIGVVQ
jgi:phospholipase C